jgi:hypothetical protein
MDLMAKDATREGERDTAKGSQAPARVASGLGAGIDLPGMILTDRRTLSRAGQERRGVSFSPIYFCVATAKFTPRGTVDGLRGTDRGGAR